MRFLPTSKVCFHSVAIFATEIKCISSHAMEKEQQQVKSATFIGMHKTHTKTKTKTRILFIYDPFTVFNHKPFIIMYCI